MFWMTKEIQEDLQERLQSDYRKVKWILTWQPIVILFLGCFVLLIKMFPIPPILGSSYNPSVSDLAIVGVIGLFFLFVMAILFIYLIKMTDYQLNKRLVGSLYNKRQWPFYLFMSVAFIVSGSMDSTKLFGAWWVYPASILSVIALIFILGFLNKKLKLFTRIKWFFQTVYRTIGLTVIVFVLTILLIVGLAVSCDKLDQMMSISHAAHDFGRKIEVPTSFPFQVQDSSGISSENDQNQDELNLTYFGDTDTLDLFITAKESGNPKGTVVTLANGEKAWFNMAIDSELSSTQHSAHLVWVHDHLWYSMYLIGDKHTFTQAEILKVANSFQPFKSK